MLLFSTWREQFWRFCCLGINAFTLFPKSLLLPLPPSPSPLPQPLKGRRKKSGTFGWCPPQSGAPPLPQLWWKYQFFLSKIFFMLRIPWNEKKIDQTWKWNFYPPPPPPHLNYAKYDLLWSGISAVVWHLIFGWIFPLEIRFWWT